jgi:hypothetical protein
MTTNPLSTDPEVIAVAGDWHGNLVFALQQLLRIHQAGAQLIVHVGDFGYFTPGPTARRFLLRLDQSLAELGLTLLFVDGNHEDHARLAARAIDPSSGLRTLRPTIHHLPRGLRWRWAGRTWLALGGAVSVDRHRRRDGHDWWPQEVIDEHDVRRAVEAGPVDVMVTHDAPAGVRIPRLRSTRFPAHAVADAEAHRVLLRSVVEQVRPRSLWHGHYHVRYRDELRLGSPRADWRHSGTGEQLSCVVHGLGDDGGHWAENVAFVGPDGAPVTPS